MELHAHPHLQDTHWHDVSSVKPLGSYPVRPALRDASMSSCFPFGRRPFDLWVWFSCTRGWLGSRIRWRVIWAHLVLLTYHTFNATLWRIPHFGRDVWIPDWLAWSPSVSRYTSDGWFDFIVSWYSVEPFLSLSAGFAFPDIVVILGRSYLRCVDSRVTIFSGVHVRSFVHPHRGTLELSG